MTKISPATFTHSGVLVIDKPAGPTSHDICQMVKRIAKVKRVGHLGTLDPAATGVLPLVINEATKRAKELAGREKIYEFTLNLGTSTDTDDDQGRAIATAPLPDRITERLSAILPCFTGEILQRPPNYSSVQVKGKRAYAAARSGEKIDLEARTVVIDSIQILSFPSPLMGEGQGEGDHKIRMRVECRSGTYVRSIARDIGELLGCGAHASHIRRLRSGRYTIDDAITPEQLIADQNSWSQHLLDRIER